MFHRYHKVRNIVAKIGMNILVGQSIPTRFRVVFIQSTHIKLV
jgi:hypothetical protein